MAWPETRPEDCTDRSRGGSSGIPALSPSWRARTHDAVQHLAYAVEGFCRGGDDGVDLVPGHRQSVERSAELRPQLARALTVRVEGDEPRPSDHAQGRA